MIVVIAESLDIFRKYFHPRLFRLLHAPISQGIRGTANCLLIRFGRYWKCHSYTEDEKEFLFYCHTHNITIIDIEEPGNA